jgi:hypothetical protein
VELARHFDIPYIVILDKDSYAAAERKIVAICQATGSPLNQEELLVIDTAAAVNCSTAKEAAQTRDTVNDVLMRRHIFCLGSDIEGAVALSYTKPSILHALGPEGARHLNADNVTELNELSGRAFDERLWKLVGSKSWNTEKASKDHKPKPHVLPMAISIVTGRRRRNSDLSALEGAILEFVRNLKPTDPVANQVDAV